MAKQLFCVDNKKMKKPTRKEDKRLQARALEVVYDVHLDGDLVLETLKVLKQGLYKAFVKWHKNDKNHTHVGLILREKPKYEYHLLKKIFKVGEVEPTLVQPLRGGNLSPKKKLATYCSYLTDGHDNGRFENTWNYKFDFELEGLKNDGKILCLLSRKKTFREIIDEGDWNFKAYCMKNKDAIDKMINNWKKFNDDSTIYHTIDEFKPEVTKLLEKWDHKKETLILKGPTGAGKTELAKAALKALTGKNPIFCRNLNKLRFRDIGQPFILDDMNFNRISREKGIHLTDLENESDIRILFGIHTIEAGAKRIFTTNEAMEDYLPYDSTGAIRRRIRIIDVTQYGKLY